MNDNDIKKALSSAEVPEELEPQNIKAMLDEKNSLIKRKKIRHRSLIRIVSAVAACAVISTFAFNLAQNKNSIKPIPIIDQNSTMSSAKEAKENAAEVKQLSYMKGASDYKQIYSCFSTEKNNKKSFIGSAIDKIKGSENKSLDTYNGTENFAASDKMTETDGASSDSAANNHDYTDTFNQESDVYEADIVKTDGNRIYYSSYNKVNVASVDKGKFTGTYSINPLNDLNLNQNVSANINDMYLFNGKLVVILSTYTNNFSDGCDDVVACSLDSSTVYAVVYSVNSETPKLLSFYRQDGSYNDVRMINNSLYIVTNSYSGYCNTIKNESDIDAYIPKYYVGDKESYIPAENILLPQQPIKDMSQLAYTIIGGIDVSSDTINEVDIKALADYSGSIYCSKDNLYVTVGYEGTAITRFALSDGLVTPSACTEIDGYVNDQFSMSEYNGYFRIATSSYGNNILVDTYSESAQNSQNEETNNVYVLDMNLNVVGKSADFGKSENIKSVNFNGNLAYVVTYEQTDPLFAIDLSNPQSPTILDDYKINGYSTYMQKWGDNLLLGFGVNADENGIENGIKATMFDTSDPSQLKEAGSLTLTYDGAVDNTNYEYGGSLSSSACYDRKQLFINSDKNLIGFPVNEYSFNYGDSENYQEICKNKYVFYSYSDGQFNLCGEIDSPDGSDTSAFDRAVMIDGIMYAVSGNRFTSADTVSFTTIDTIEWAS